MTITALNGIAQRFKQTLMCGCSFYASHKESDHCSLKG